MRLVTIPLLFCLLLLNPEDDLTSHPLQGFRSREKRIHCWSSFVVVVFYAREPTLKSFFTIFVDSIGSN